jgi:hypothetical protein
VVARRKRRDRSRGVGDRHRLARARAVTLTASGVVEGPFTVASFPAPESVAAADVVIVALPAPAYAGVLPRVAPHLSSSQHVFVSGALSLAPLWLAELAATHGHRPTVAASGRRSPPGGPATAGSRS